MKKITTLLSPDSLKNHLSDPDWAIFDCRFGLADTKKGRWDYLESHIPGAVYVHLEEELSGPIIPGVTGRHPLPELDFVVEKFSELGIDEAVQVVVYDDTGGFIASRLWWMCRWLGHPAAAVLDGGWQAWRAAGYPVESGKTNRAPRNFVPKPRPELRIEADEILEHLEDRSWKVIDSRTEVRYRGEEEPIDPVAGRIPGALNAPNAENIGSNGFYLSREVLRDRFNELLAGTSPEKTVFYCGSGVSAARNLLAMAHAGLGDGRLYVGSWSDWITDPNRPITRD
jgi:thiosulfate/3-mercaptopyruvate sulfurtransferase